MLRHFSHVRLCATLWTAAHQTPLSMEDSKQEYWSGLLLSSPPRRHKWQKKEMTGLPWWLSGAESACQCKRHEFDPWSGKIPHAVKQLSPRTTTIKPVLQSPRTTTTEAHTPQSPCSATREATATRNPRTATREQPLLFTATEKPVQQQRPSAAKKKSE